MLDLRYGKEGLRRIADISMPSLKEYEVSKMMLVCNAQVYLGCRGDWWLVVEGHYCG